MSKKHYNRRKQNFNGLVAAHADRVFIGSESRSGVWLVARSLDDAETIVSTTHSHLLPDEKSMIKDYFDSQNCGKSVVRKIKKS
jgi:hypothetical protein